MTEHRMVSRGETNKSMWTFSFLSDINKKRKGIMVGEPEITVFSRIGMFLIFTIKYCFMGEPQEWT